MLGLKREIIKERDAVGDVGKGGTKEIWAGDTEGDADRCNLDMSLCLSLEQQEVHLMRLTEKKLLQKKQCLIGHI